MLLAGLTTAVDGPISVLLFDSQVLSMVKKIVFNPKARPILLVAPGCSVLSSPCTVGKEKWCCCCSLRAI
jgi:hypothetical protein